MQTERSPEKTLRALGLCAKARRLVMGTPMVCEALRSRQKPYLVVAAADSSANTLKRLCDKCAFYNVRLELLPIGGEELGCAVGKRGAVAAVAVTDENLSHMVEITLK